MLFERIRTTLSRERYPERNEDIQFFMRVIHEYSSPSLAFVCSLNAEQESESSRILSKLPVNWIVAGGSGYGKNWLADRILKAQPVDTDEFGHTEGDEFIIHVEEAIHAVEDRRARVVLGTGSNYRELVESLVSKGWRVIMPVPSLSTYRRINAAKARSKTAQHNAAFRKEWTRRSRITLTEFVKHVGKKISDATIGESLMTIVIHHTHENITQAFHGTSR